MNWKQAIGATFWTILKVTAAVVIVVMIYRFAVKAYDMGYRVFADTAMDETSTQIVTVAIVEGKTVHEIGEILEDKGLIRDAWLFVVQEKCSSYADCLQPGIYELSPSMTPYEIMEIMSETTEETE